MELEDKVMLAVKRIEHILKHESNEITSVTPDDEGSILIHLSNGMNLHLTSGEMEYRADEQLEVEFEKMVQLDRDEVVDTITQNYIDSMITDAKRGDTSFIFEFVKGDGGTQIDRMTNEELVVEYKELFNKDVVINDVIIND